MVVFLVIVHIIVSIALIAIVLLQSGKGAEMGASFGASGSQSVFGAGGSNTFMSKMTTGAAIIFMLTSLTLAFLSGHSGSSSIMRSTKVAPKALPLNQATPAQPPIQGQPAGVPKSSQPAKQNPAPAPAVPNK
jgi:preprotein translocase subunit SecG